MNDEDVSLGDEDTIPTLGVQNAPERIWLVVGELLETSDFNDLRDNTEGVLWCDSPQDAHDVEYVRADLVANAEPSTAMMRAGPQALEHDFDAVTQHAVPIAQYPVGDVLANCLCGSWPGGPCLRCPTLEQVAWRAYSKAWPESMCWYEFYHDGELAAARERATAIARGLRIE